MPCSPPGNLPNPGIEPTPLASPTLVGECFTHLGTLAITHNTYQNLQEMSYPSMLVSSITKKTIAISKKLEFESPFS